MMKPSREAMKDGCATNPSAARSASALVWKRIAAESRNVTPAVTEGRVRSMPSTSDHVLLYIVYGTAMLALLCLLFLLPIGCVRWLATLGWVLFAASAVLGWVPILTFRRRGRVAKRKTYIHTTKLVTSGLYAIVRHPQFFASDLLAAGVMCITQHWSVYLAGAIAVVGNHLTMQRADRDLVTKFGEAYAEYMKQVPQWNPVVGLWRWLQRRPH